MSNKENGDGRPKQKVEWVGGWGVKAILKISYSNRNSLIPNKHYTTFGFLGGFSDHFLLLVLLDLVTKNLILFTTRVNNEK